MFKIELDINKKLIIQKGLEDFSYAITEFVLVQSSMFVAANNINLQNTLSISDELQQQVKEIDKISTEISKISTQTQILSINASIEAARAGNAGRGFSVVATEIGTLSKRTKECTKKVDDINMRTYEKVKQSHETINKISVDLSDFSDGSKRMSDMLSQNYKIEENGFIITQLAKYLSMHAKFIHNLLDNIGKLEQVVDHYNCSLGKWYEANRDKYNNIEAFAELFEIHKSFHETAAEFNKSLDSSKLMHLVKISQEILNSFLKLRKVFENKVLTDDSFFEGILTEELSTVS